MNDELTQLAVKYGADKAPQIKHGYTPFYFSLFKDKRNEVKKVLEIGAGEGASLRMWQDFFPSAMIYSGEIEDGRLFKKDRIEVIKCDQTDLASLLDLIEKTGSDIDLFVDDGTHKPHDQLYSWQVLMPLLGKNVTYVIEDVDKAGSEDLFNIIKAYGYECEMHEFGPRHDDRVILVRQK